MTRTGGTIENVDPYMVVVEERVARADHENDAVQPDVCLLHPDPAKGEAVAQHDDKERGQHHRQSEPRHPAPDGLHEPIDDPNESR